MRRSGLMIVGVRAALAVLLMLAPLAAARAGNDAATSGLPVPPEGYEIARIDVVVRLRRKRQAL